MTRFCKGCHCCLSSPPALKQQLSDTRRLEVQWRIHVGLNAKPAQPRQTALLPSCEFLSTPSLQSCKAARTAVETLEIRSYWHVYISKQAFTDHLCRQEITLPVGLQWWSTLLQICKTGGSFFGIFLGGVVFVCFFPAHLLFWIFIWMKLRTGKTILPTECSTAIHFPKLEKTTFITKKVRWRRQFILKRNQN